MPENNTQNNGGSGFDPSGLLDFGMDFIKSCEFNCWGNYPPFSGKGQLRTACLQYCRQGPPPPPSNNSGISTSSLLTLGALGLGAFVLMDKPKTRRRR